MNWNFQNNSSDDDNSVVLVRILVEDENDNPPEFDQPQYYRGKSILLMLNLTILLYSYTQCLM
jgi:hypothetical protein